MKHNWNWSQLFRVSSATNVTLDAISKILNFSIELRCSSTQFADFLLMYERLHNIHSTLVKLIDGNLSTYMSCNRVCIASIIFICSIDRFENRTGIRQSMYGCEQKAKTPKHFFSISVDRGFVCIKPQSHIVVVLYCIDKQVS